MPAEMYVPAFFLKQAFSLTTNRYELYAANPDGSFGQPLGLAQQKRLAFKEEVTFYTDESKSRAVFSFKARKRIDLNAGYDVLDEHGRPLGFFRKDFTSSLLRSTFRLEGPGYVGVGQERSAFVGIVRRLVDVPFLPIHFDFRGPDGEQLLQVERQASVRDKYTVQVHHQQLDFRMAAAVAVGLDTLMQR